MSSYSKVNPGRLEVVSDMAAALAGLQPYLLDVIVVDVAVATGPDELADHGKPAWAAIVMGEQRASWRC